MHHARPRLTGPLPRRPPAGSRWLPWLLLAVSLPLRGQEEERRTYDLPAADAAPALVQLSAVSGREVLFAAEAVRGLRSRPVQGNFTPLEAARHLLGGTSLRVRQDARTGALAIRPEAPAVFPPDHVARRDAALQGEFQTAQARPARAFRGPVMQALEPLLLQQARHLVSELRPWSHDPAAELLPRLKGAASGEHGIRPNAHAAKGLALLVRLLPDAAFAKPLTRARARDHALRLLRYLVQTHGPDGETCDDGRAWQGQWQSAYWAAMTGEAGWLLWDELSAEEKWRTALMITREADRFVGVNPPAALVNDTKAEENAWNSQILSLAACLFPNHPRHAAWREAAIRWMACSFPRPSDLQSTEPVDGRPLRDWLTGANLHEDFTLENHRRVHPDYLACTYLLTSQIPMYAWAGRAPPAALARNLAGINRTLQRLALPDGSWAYPNGQDWGLRRQVDTFEFHATMAAVYGDPVSAGLRQLALATLRAMGARSPAGPITTPEETRLPSDQAMALELPAHSYALMAQLGEGPAPVAEASLWTGQAGRQVFPAGRFGLLRTPRSFASISWGAQVMALVVPLRRDLLFAPESHGLVGYLGVAGTAREAPVARDVQVAPLTDALGVTGVLDRAGGAVEQRFGFLALPDGRTVYVDVLRLTGATRPTVAALGTVGILNDRNWPYHDGTRTLAFEGGGRELAAADAATAPEAEFHSPWYNLDGFGIVCVATSGRQLFQPRPSSAPGRLEQRFHLNALSEAALGATPANARLAYSVLVFHPAHSAAQTRAAARHTRLASPPGAHRVALVLEDGRAVDFDLDRLEIKTAPTGQEPAR